MEEKKQWQKWHKKCKKCGTITKPYKAKGMCESCYDYYYWKKHSEFREKHKLLTYKWRDEHPERWKEIVYKAVRKYQLKNKEKINEYNKKRYHDSNHTRKSKSTTSSTI